jgi:hypothetical protein
MTIKFNIGDKVIKNPETWQVNEFDGWGRGLGIGTVIDSPFPVDDLDLVDVRWPTGRCFEACGDLLPMREFDKTFQ